MGGVLRAAMSRTRSLSCLSRYLGRMTSDPGLPLSGWELLHTHVRCAGAQVESRESAGGGRVCPAVPRWALPFASSPRRSLSPAGREPDRPRASGDRAKSAVRPSITVLPCRGRSSRTSRLGITEGGACAGVRASVYPADAQVIRGPTALFSLERHGPLSPRPGAPLGPRRDAAGVGL